MDATAPARRSRPSMIDIHPAYAVELTVEPRPALNRRVFQQSGWPLRPRTTPGHRPATTMALRPTRVPMQAAGATVAQRGVPRHREQGEPVVGVSIVSRSFTRRQAGSYIRSQVRPDKSQSGHTEFKVSDSLRNNGVSASGIIMTKFRDRPCRTASVFT